MGLLSYFFHRKVFPLEHSIKVLPLVVTDLVTTQTPTVVISTTTASMYAYCGSGAPSCSNKTATKSFHGLNIYFIMCFGLNFLLTILTHTHTHTLHF